MGKTDKLFQVNMRETGRIASDLFWYTGAAQEMRLEPAEATCSLVVPLSLLLTRCRGRYTTGARSDLS